MARHMTQVPERHGSCTDMLINYSRTAEKR